MEGGHDLGVVPGVGPVEVLAKDDIAEPMEAVLYSPTTLALGCDVAGGGLYHQQATDEVDHLAVVTPLIGAGTVQVEKLAPRRGRRPIREPEQLMTQVAQRP